MTKEFTVRDISCGHCAQAIRKEVQSVQGVQNVQVDVNTKHVRVEANEQVTTDVIVNAINEAGYADVTVLN
jgi:copper chaperone CopZ